MSKKRSKEGETASRNSNKVIEDYTEVDEQETLEISLRNSSKILDLTKYPRITVSGNSEKDKSVSDSNSNRNE